MDKSVLFISIDGMTDPLGQSQVLPYLGGLSKNGYDITLISCDKPDRYSKHKAQIEAICKTLHIEWHSTPYKNSPPLISSITNIKRLTKLANELHQKKAFDLIHCRSYLPMISGINLKKKYGVKLLFDIRGFWADERVDGGTWNLKKPLWKFIYKYFKQKEKEFFKSADRVITLTNNAKNEVLSWKLTDGEIPIDVIPTCADLELFDYNKIKKEDQLELLKSLNLSPDDFIVSYLGSLGTYYAIDDMLRLFKNSKDKHNNAKFLVITASDPNIVWHALDRNDIRKEDVRVTKASRENVPLHLSLSKYSLIFYRENYSRKACSPTKLGELMGLGIPSISSPNVGDTTEIISTTKSGIALNSMDQNAMKRAVEEIDAFTDKSAIRKEAFNYFDLEEGIKKYTETYNKMLK